MTAKPKMLRKQLFVLCFLHALLCVRRKFGALGYNMPYDFSVSDLQASALTLQDMHSSNELRMEGVTYMLAEVIYGGHVSEYMELLEEEDPDRYQSQFSKWIEKEIEADTIEEMYKECHKKIREDPEHQPTEKKASYPQVNEQIKRTLAERKAAIQNKKDAMRAALEAADDDDDDEDDE